MLTCIASLALSLQLEQIVDPPPLPSPPLLDSLLFEAPGAWIIVLLLVIIAAVFISRPQRRLKLTGFAAITLAVAVAVVQHLVITDHEAILASTRAAVVAVSKADIPTLQRLLAPQFRAVYFEFPLGLSKEESIARITKYHENYPAAVSVSEVRAAVDNQRFGRAHVQTTSPIASWWVISWEKTASGWQISGAETTFSTNFNR